MKTQLTLQAPLIANPGKRAAAIAAEVVNSTAFLERDVKDNIRRSVAAGRTYRTTAIVRRATRKNSTLKLAKRPGGVVIGYNFHRASRTGQPPAIRTGRLINSIRGVKIATFSGRINVGVEYGLPLDDPDGLDRPFFTSRVELFRPVFFERIRKATLG